MIGQNIIAWNYRGAKSSEFLREMRDLCRLHHSKIIVLIEPRISRAEADVVCMTLGKSRWSYSEAERSSEGIWLLWDVEEIQVKFLYVNRMFLHAKVCSDGGELWELMGINASPIAQVRRNIWSMLDLMTITWP